MVKQKLKVRFDVTVTKIENAPAALKGESIYLEWRRGRTHGCTDSVVLCDTDVAFRASPEDHSQFSFNCSMLREPKTMKISTKVMVLLLKIDVESMGSVFAASLGGDVIGRATFKLSNYATKTGATAQLCFALSEKCSVKPTPMVYLSMHCEWLRADGKRLEPVQSQGSSTMLVSGMPVATISDGDQTFALRPRGMTSAEFGGVGGDDDDTMTSESESDASDAGSDLDPDDLADPFGEEEDQGPNNPLAQVLGFSLWKDDHLSFSLRRTPNVSASTPALSSSTSSSKSKPKSRLTRRGSIVGLMARRPLSDKVAMRFTISVLEASGLPVAYANNLLFVSWRRGSKKENQGKTTKSMCDRNGHVSWEESVTAEGDKDKNSFSLKATMTRDSKQGKLEDKTIAFTLKRQAEGKTTRLGHTIVNLSELVEVKDHDLPTVTTLELPVTTAKQSKNDPKIKVRISSVVENEGDASETEEGAAPAKPKHVDIFGRPLLDALVVDGKRVYDVPPILTKIAAIIEANSLDVEGIFRLCGRTSEVKDVQTAFSEGRAEAIDLGAVQPHTLCSTYKAYLRALPNTLLPSDMYNEFIAIGAKFTESQKDKPPGTTIAPVSAELLHELRELLAKCPVEHQASILHLCQFLERVQEHDAANKMTYDNLAIVFGPTILSSATANADPFQMIADNGMKIAVTKLLLSHWRDLVAQTFDWTAVDAAVKAANPEPLPPPPAAEPSPSPRSTPSLSKSSSVGSTKSPSGGAGPSLLPASSSSASSDQAKAIATYKKQVASLDAELQETKALLSAKDRISKSKEAELEKLQRAHRRLRLLAQCFFCISGPKYTRLELRVRPFARDSPQREPELVSYSAQEVVLKIIGWRALRPLDGALASSVVHSLRLSAEKTNQNDDFQWYWLSTACSLLDLLQRSPECELEGGIQDLGVMVVVEEDNKGSDGTSNTSARPQHSNQHENVDDDDDDDEEEQFEVELTTGGLRISSLSELDRHLNKLAYEIFTTLLNHFSTSIDDKVVALLDRTSTNLLAAQGTSPIGFITTKLTHLLELATSNNIPHSVIRQFFHEVFFFINKTLFNLVMQTPKYCTTQIGIQIKLGLGQFEPWLETVAMPWREVIREARESRLAHLDQLANLLVTATNMSVFSADDAGLAYFPQLQASHVRYVLSNYSPVGLSVRESKSFGSEIREVLKRLERLDNGLPLYISEMTTLHKMG